MIFETPRRRNEVPLSYRLCFSLHCVVVVDIIIMLGLVVAFGTS